MKGEEPKYNGEGRPRKKEQPRTNINREKANIADKK